MVAVLKNRTRYTNQTGKKRTKGKKITLPRVSIVDNCPVYPPRPAAQALTARANMILKTIEALPGLTVMEYADIAIEPAAMIHAMLLHTQLGQWLAITGKVALPRLGSKPEWFKKIPEALRTFVPVKTPEVQLYLPALDESIPQAIQDKWSVFGEDIARMICRNTSSPRVRRARMAEIAAHINTSAAREAIAVETIQAIQLAIAPPSKRAA